MQLLKITYTTNDLGEISKATKLLLNGDNSFPFKEIVIADLLVELTTNLASEVLSGEEETDEDRREHLEETIYESDEKDIIVYDGSGLAQIHYVLLSND